jgi:hypothetical protein
MKILTYLRDSDQEVTTGAVFFDRADFPNGIERIS